MIRRLVGSQAARFCVSHRVGSMGCQNLLIERLPEDWTCLGVIFATVPEA